ncbi:hypothetical protein [Nocardia sp. NBC_01327]|uniref:hypothetical protein n=1 Tax=Nocardia sp. NBC_01327 TaxID=2903593 RepID=UPI002E10065B|nr:hypothetical protein OG326_42315 [Nocardia sp. NBC_01327]
MLIYRWLQTDAQMIIFGVIVGWVVVVSVLVRAAPAGRRALSRIHPMTWVRRRMRRFAWWPWP